MPEIIYRMLIRYGLVTLVLGSLVYIARLLIQVFGEAEPNAAVAAILGSIATGLAGAFAITVKDLYPGNKAE